ncbi:hemicentin-2 [Polymixia lowei]
MRCSRLWILGLVLYVAHCLEIQDMDEKVEIEINHNITGILGEDVYLSCQYLGELTIRSATWKRDRKHGNKFKSMRLAGFRDGNAFSRDIDFSIPVSPTNLTVKMRVSSLEAEGFYTCEFEFEAEEIQDVMFLTVLARPDTRIQVHEETVNGTHYQSVSCSAASGRPVPQVSWLINGAPPRGDPFTEETSQTIHLNGTGTVSKVLRFPTHLQDEDTVTCVVRHPTLPNPNLTVRVDTYVTPKVSINAEMIQEEGRLFWVISCMASGGKPETNISFVRTTNGTLQMQEDMSSDTQTNSYRLPAEEFEGHNITCVFDHPKFTHKESRVITLPSIYLSGVRLLPLGLVNTSGEIPHIEMQEGQSDITIGLQVIGNTPLYTISCNKDDEPLPDGVQVVGRALTFNGSVEFHHAGLYECVASNDRHRATIQFNITVNPQVVQPELVPPTIGVDLQARAADRVIECSAADAVPAANMSWLLPEGVSGVSWFNFTSHNGSHSVRGVLVLPACSPWELTVECVINHPVFEKPENRSITLPLCASPNVTVNTSTEWRGGEEYTVAECRVDSVAPAATVTWRVGDGDDSVGLPEEVEGRREVRDDGLVAAQSTVRFPSSLYSGQRLTCVMEHQSLAAPEETEIYIPAVEAPALAVSVVRQQDSPLWLAVCDYRGVGVKASLAWILPESAGQPSRHSEDEGPALETRLTYAFPLALYEGQDLTCVIQYQHGRLERRTVHVPRYYISCLRVQNHTTPFQSRYGGNHVILRVALRENLCGQRILLHVDGNVPSYHLTCQRSDGSFGQMEGVALVFQSEVTEQDEGLYTCRAAFYHHKATVYIQVDVILGDKKLLLAIICLSSASAITLFFVICLWVFCMRNYKTQKQKVGSLAALTSLMQDPCSPELKKAAAPQSDSQEYAQLVSYSIVIDVKTTV